MTARDGGAALADLRALLAELDAAVQHAERLAAALETLEHDFTEAMLDATRNNGTLTEGVPVLGLDAARSALAAWKERGK